MSSSRCSLRALRARLNDAPFRFVLPLVCLFVWRSVVLTYYATLYRVNPGFCLLNPACRSPGPCTTAGPRRAGPNTPCTVLRGTDATGRSVLGLSLRAVRAYGTCAQADACRRAARWMALPFPPCSPSPHGRINRAFACVSRTPLLTLHPDRSARSTPLRATSPTASLLF